VKLHDVEGRDRQRFGQQRIRRIDEKAHARHTRRHGRTECRGLGRGDAAGEGGKKLKPR